MSMRRAQSGMKRSVTALAALMVASALAAVPSVSVASHAACGPGNPALDTAAADVVAHGETNWYDASSAEEQYIAVYAASGIEILDLKVFAWDGATGCSQVARRICNFGCVDPFTPRLGALGPFAPGSYQVSVHGEALNPNPVHYVVTSLPVAVDLCGALGC